MGLISSILGLPLLPVRGVVAIGRVIERQVDQELHSPAAVRRRLEAAEAQAEDENGEVNHDAE